jgi:chorismate mutase/prephenate dehydratase
LEPLYRAGLNLTLIQSRPLPGNPFEYFFFVDFEGDAEDKKVKEALATMNSRVERLRVLGSYPQIRR